MITRLDVYTGILLCALSTSALADHPTVAFGLGGAGPINTISADALPTGAWGLGIQTEIINNDEFDTEQLEDFAASGLEGVHSVDKITNTSVSLAYGVTDNFSVSVRLPYTQRDNIREGEIEDGEAEAHTHGDSSGYGDLLLLSQYQFSTSENTNISGIFGIKAPTGETKVKDVDDLRFETEFQPGTGSWDVLVGAAINGSSGRLGYHTNFLYNKSTEGSQSTEIGDAFSYNAALTYRLNEHDHASHDHSDDTGTQNDELNWDLILEVNGEHRSANQISGISEEHSGGNTVFLSPGVRLSSGSLSGFVSYGIPLIEDQNGTQTDVNQRIVAGFSIAF